MATVFKTQSFTAFVSLVNARELGLLQSNNKPAAVGKANTSADGKMYNLLCMYNSAFPNLSISTFKTAVGITPIIIKRLQQFRHLRFITFQDLHYLVV